MVAPPWTFTAASAPLPPAITLWLSQVSAAVASMRYRALPRSARLPQNRLSWSSAAAELSSRYSAPPPVVLLLPLSTKEQPDTTARSLPDR